MKEDEMDYGIEDFDAIGDRYIEEIDDDYDYMESDPIDMVAIAFRYGEYEGELS